MEELIKKAEEKGCDSLFITILKERPLYPKEYVDHDIPEFGMKISPINGLHWLSDFDFGYILGRVYASEKSGRLKDWFECVFPMVDRNGNPTEYVVGLYENQFKITPQEGERK